MIKAREPRESGKRLSLAHMSRAQDKEAGLDEKVEASTSVALTVI